MTTTVVDVLRAHMLPGPLPRPDLSRPDDQIDHADVQSWFQFDQLWQLIDHLEDHPTASLSETRHRRIFHAQDRQAHSPAQHACLASVTRWTLLLLDHAEATTTRPSGRPEPAGGGPHHEDLHGTRAIWAGHPAPTPTAETRRIAQQVEEIRKRLRRR